MSTKREKIIWVVITCVGLLAVMNFLQDYFGVSEKKSGYVEIPLLFEQFEMKQELQQKMEVDLKDKRILLDSLMFQLQTINNELDSQEDPAEKDIRKFQNLQQYYLQQKQTVEAYSIEQTEKYDQQILDQLNQYVKDFGDKYEYEYVFGVNNNGTIMYAKQPNNITEEVVTFINARYQGEQ